MVHTVSGSTDKSTIGMAHCILLMAAVTSIARFTFWKVIRQWKLGCSALKTGNALQN
jgi:branched-subunit amino acid transport protein